MTEKQYVAKILKKVYADKEHKKQIKEQLLERVQKYMEQEKDLFKVIGKMGSPFAVAEEYNKSIEEAEKNKAKKIQRVKSMLKILSVICVLGALVYWSFPKYYDLQDSTHFKEQQVQEQFDAVMGLLEQGDYDGLQQCASKDMQSVLTAKMIEAARRNLAENWGNKKNVEECVFAEMVKKGNYYAVGRVAVEYENVTVIYTLTFDSHMKLSGLHME